MVNHYYIGVKYLILQALNFLIMKQLLLLFLLSSLCLFACSKDSSSGSGIVSNVYNFDITKVVEAKTFVLVNSSNSLRETEKVIAERKAIDDYRFIRQQGTSFISSYTLESDSIIISESDGMLSNNNYSLDGNIMTILPLDYKVEYSLDSLKSADFIMIIKRSGLVFPSITGGTLSHGDIDDEAIDHLEGLTNLGSAAIGDSITVYKFLNKYMPE